jgi:glyoxylase-like metal-dependent hydrolase (beta-lactamase superfamily II)
MFDRYAVSLTLAALLLGTSPARSQEPTVEVEELAPNVYLFTYNTHRSLFVTTDEGVLATDPQSTEAATRFLEEIKKVSEAPIRYLVYSHHHDDHVSGGAVFGGDVMVVAHEAVASHIEGEIRAPDVTFQEASSLHLGELEVRLLYPGPSETESNIIVYVRDRGVAFMVDTVSVRRLPWRDFGGTNPSDWIRALEVLSELEFDVLAPGHGSTGTKEHVTENIEYLTALMTAVQERIAQGQSLEQIQESLELPQYQDWVRYDEHFDLNIEGAFKALSQ